MHCNTLKACCTVAQHTVQQLVVNVCNYCHAAVSNRELMLQELIYFVVRR
jgi:hypothetical protein